MLEFELRFSGFDADDGLIEFYDGARALAGFQRSLALSLHLALNGEVITHATALAGAKIFLPAIEEGSWKSKALVALGTITTLGSVGRDSPVGHVVTSIYDYVVSETMGFHPDYEQTLQHQYGEYLREKRITKDKLDSVIEKSENSVADMHRPVVISETASAGELFKIDRTGRSKIGPDINSITYEYVKTTIKDPNETELIGMISSFNNNTFKDRVFSFDDQRPIPFELMPQTRSVSTVGIITRSQHESGQKRPENAVVKMAGHRLESATGRLKRLHVTSVALPN